MTKSYKNLTADIAEYMAELRQECPDAMKGFGQLATKSIETNALTSKEKELAALAIGVTQRCDGCIGFHVKKLIELGTTRSELAELMTVCVYMGGGPALMYAADALRAFDELSN